MISAFSKLSPLAIAAALALLPACNGDDTSGSPSHQIVPASTSNTAPPAVEARSDSSALIGGIGQAPVSSQSDRYRLRFDGIRPSISK